MAAIEYKKELFEFKYIQEDKNLYIEGYCSKFNIVDNGNDEVIKGATLKYTGDLKRIKLCWQHEKKDVIGKILELYEDEIGIYFKARISNTRLGKDAAELVLDEAIDEISIGYVTYEKEYRGAVRLLTGIEIREISLVTWGMNKEAFITQTEVKNEPANDIPSEKPIEEYTNDELLSKRQDIEKEISKRIINLV